MLQFESGM